MHMPVCHISTATCIEGDVRLGVGNLTDFYISVNEYESYFFVNDELARGRVEVCVGGRYGTVCDDYFDNTDASVVCRQLGFSSYGKCIYASSFYLKADIFLSNTGAIALPTGFFGADIDVELHNVSCVGTEISLLECDKARTATIFCESREDAAIICQGS